MHPLLLKFLYKTDASFKVCMPQEGSYYFSMLDPDCRMVHHGELNYFPAALFHSSSYYMLLKKLKTHISVY